MDSKYDLLGSKSVKKFHLSPKPKPIIFNSKNGPSSPKKIKFNNTKFETNSLSVTNGKSKIDIQEQKKKLPVFQKRAQLLNLIQKHDTLIILGETGSGKTTQIPQFIHSARLQNNGRIGITQPRRVAAVSVAIRVAQEMGNTLGVGEIVGYTVRFEDVTSKRTKIKYLTDGMLLREAIADKLLMDYTVLILDEAHERTIHTDVLFGIVKDAQKNRKEKKLTPLKVLLMSATMDVDHFSKYFNNCQAVYLEGRTYPVNVFYTKTTHEDYQTACIATFFKIHREAPANHDVLMFLTGQEEIEAVAHQIKILAKDPDVEGPPIKVCTLYASQPSTQQMTVFQPAGPNTRKLIISTNVAETSVTISGIKYVIDSGMVKARTFHPSTGLDLLKIQRTSQEQAWQRTGRAGREAEGSCYRIYTKAQFEMMQKTTTPEIQRANLATVAIQLLALGIHAMRFDFMDKPPKDAVRAAFEQLKRLEAINDIDKSDLTPLGKNMAQFPLDPRFSKVLLSAQNYGCLEEALTIVALMSGESIFLNPPSKREQAQTSRQKYCSALGDHITLLNIYREFNNISQNNKRSWCRDNYIHMRNILYAREVRTQLADVCRRCEIPVSSCGSNMDQVRKCLLTGLFTNIAEIHKDKQYITLDKRQVVTIHPSSVLHGQLPPLLLFTEVVQTTKCYLRGISTIEREWLDEIVPNYIRSHNIRSKD
ncbi:PREDICTED: putative ATP-dependent RNA helicase DHX33 [Nicrophorus vespilloides]|uniref:RNA helicase n=1 Tax=Nicrophorus vespilloides TaxID=110193 RepID=A0ABM1M589_NICVS|nr:PREDICTED: putative ATP-dependent RNA helicase DHX33 [Nicrophorus vespilloides]